MKVLVINAGSSSLKYQFIDMENETVLAKGLCERIGQSGNIIAKANDATCAYDIAFPTHTEAFLEVVKVLTTGETKVIDSMDEISAVGHRIVQGADIFSNSVLVTNEVIDQIDNLAELAPVHNHAHALALRACQKVLDKSVPQVVVFDTAFHQTIPQKAYMYAIPYECYEKYHIRKYGFHGTSHKYVSERFAEFIGKDKADLKVVTCHLGNGSSISAVDGGKCVDTTMGFTPLDGILMGTRSGAIDASAVAYLAEKLSMSHKEVADFLNKKCGFLGVSECSSDCRDLLAAIDEGNKKALLAMDMFEYQLAKYIASFAAAMNGIDGIVFTGGIGENTSTLRKNVCKQLSFLGVEVEDSKNDGVRGEEVVISSDNSRVNVAIIPTNEELAIARETVDVVNNK